jgi:hypothetical protein
VTLALGGGTRCRRFIALTLDVSIQAQIITLLKRFCAEFGLVVALRRFKSVFPLQHRGRPYMTMPLLRLIGSRFGITGVDRNDTGGKIVDFLQQSIMIG